MILLSNSNRLFGGSKEDSARLSDEISVDKEVDEEHREEAIKSETNKDDGERSIAGATEHLKLECLVVDVETDEHLSDLQCGDGDTDLARHVVARHLDGVVGVHQRVHEEVHVHHPAGSGGGVGEDEPGVVQGQEVVHPVQGYQLTLAEQNEIRVQKLDRLRQSEEQVPHVQTVILKIEIKERVGKKRSEISSVFKCSNLLFFCFVLNPLSDWFLPVVNQTVNRFLLTILS